LLGSTATEASYKALPGPRARAPGRRQGRAPPGSAITPSVVPRVAMRPVPMAIPPSPAGIIDADHDPAGNDYDGPAIGAAMAIRSAMPSASAALGRVRRSGHAEHGRHGGDTEDCLSHVDLFQFELIPPCTLPTVSPLTDWRALSVAAGRDYLRGMRKSEWLNGKAPRFGLREVTAGASRVFPPCEGLGGRLRKAVA
jgi:hypothetical protein